MRIFIIYHFQKTVEFLFPFKDFTDISMVYYNIPEDRQCAVIQNKMLCVNLSATEVLDV